MAFADNLNHLMETNKVTNYRLAQLLGASQTSVANWREGKNVPHKKTLNAIAQLFEISLEDLTGCSLPDATLQKSKTEKPATETDDGLSEEERKFIEWFRNQASEKDKALVRMIVEGDK